MKKKVLMIKSLFLVFFLMIMGQKVAAEESYSVSETTKYEIIIESSGHLTPGAPGSLDTTSTESTSVTTFPTESEPTSQVSQTEQDRREEQETTATSLFEETGQTWTTTLQAPAPIRLAKQIEPRNVQAKSHRFTYSQVKQMISDNLLRQFILHHWTLVIASLQTRQLLFIQGNLLKVFIQILLPYSLI